MEVTPRPRQLSLIVRNVTFSSASYDNIALLQIPLCAECTGVEPAPYWETTRYLNHLTYIPFVLRVGIEPTLQYWLG